MLLLSITEAAALHNKVPDVTPFDQLPPKRQEQVYHYYLNGGIVESSFVKWAGKKLHGVTALMGFLSEAAPASDVSDIDQLALRLQPDVLKGDQKAWAQIYQAFLPYAKSLAKQELYYFPADVDDVASDAMRTLHDKISKGEWDAGTKLMTWLKYIVKNKAMNLIDKEKKHLEKDVHAVDDTDAEEDEEGDLRHASAVASDSAANPADAVEKEDDKGTWYDKTFMLRQVRKLVDGLPAEEKRALIAYAFENKPYQQIANEFGWPLHKVKSRIENARWYTRDWLARHPDMKAVMNFALEESSGIKENIVGFLKQRFGGMKESEEAITAHNEFVKNLVECEPGTKVKIVKGEFKGQEGEVKRDFPEAEYMHVDVGGNVVLVGYDQIQRERFYVEGKQLLSGIRDHLKEVETA
jgi:RNA polymerase sigma factor (sigma-70 family)